MTAMATLGGKGANLVILRDAGLPVPPFVVVPTDEYQAFLAQTGLTAVIADALHRPPAEASASIAAAFDAATLSSEQATRLLAVVGGLIDDPVAVRSSATAEDLPGMSFAGQHDSFLDVNGPSDVLAAIVACWASLWSERAITYRAQAGFDPHAVALAVVVQRMVDADSAGVLFTANPRSGRRDEVVIEAVTGWGDALVQGAVLPDLYVLDPHTGQTREQHLSGGEAIASSTQLQALTALGRRIQELYDTPMDIEWAARGGELFVVQARPITGLYPLPAPNPRPHPTPEVWFSIGAFQGVLEPLTPLGQDALRLVFAGAPRIVGRRVDWRTNRSVHVAGERLWLRVDGLLRTRATRALLHRFLPLIEPGTAAILTRLGEEPDLRPVHTIPAPATLAALTTIASRVTSRARINVRNPAAARRHLDRTAQRLIADVAARLDRAANAPTPQERLTARARTLDWVGHQALPAMLPVFGPIIAPSILQLNTLRELAGRTDLPHAGALALNVMRALPGNVTTEMDLHLADVATTIKSDANAWGWFAETNASALARHFLSGHLPRVAQQAVAEFLHEYGMRGVAEIDLGALRWRDDPTPVMHTLKSYLLLPADASPRAVHLAGQQEAGRSIRTLMDASSPARAEKIRRAAQAIRGLAGARETPKFTLVRCWGLIRSALDASAAELVEQGRLAQPADLAFLHLDEITRAFSAEWHEVVATRRADYVDERRRTQVPRILVEDGRALYEGLSAGAGDLHGAGVSPGTVEGPVRVVRDPRITQLDPGDILVCQGTDPGWTPLFLTAGGLITEVGGLMTHGSVVAREYGIPAVVGVHQATTRLRDGQRVRIDGASGIIEIV